MDGTLIYLIDDDADDREIFELVLTKVSPESVLVTAKSGAEALSKFEGDSKFLPDYVFLDLNMPGIHGIECLAELKKIDRVKNVPVIIYSTSSNPEYISDTQKLGAAHYLIKPTTLRKLIDTITSILEKRNSPFLLNADHSE